MFIILTTKPGQYRTEAGDSLRPVETYDYSMCGDFKARFVIAEFLQDRKVRVVDEDGSVVNAVPSKFFAKFATAAQARKELEHLIGFGSLDTALTRVG